MREHENYSVCKLIEIGPEMNLLMLSYHRLDCLAKLNMFSIKNNLCETLLQFQVIYLMQWQ